MIEFVGNHFSLISFDQFLQRPEREKQTNSFTRTSGNNSNPKLWRFNSYRLSMAQWIEILSKCAWSISFGFGFWHTSDFCRQHNLRISGAYCDKQRHLRAFVWKRQWSVWWITAHGNKQLLLFTQWNSRRRKCHLTFRSNEHAHRQHFGNDVISSSTLQNPLQCNIRIDKMKIMPLENYQHQFD